MLLFTELQLHAMIGNLVMSCTLMSIGDAIIPLIQKSALELLNNSTSLFLSLFYFKPMIPRFSTWAHLHWTLPCNIDVTKSYFGTGSMLYSMCHFFNFQLYVFPSDDKSFLFSHIWFVLLWRLWSLLCSNWKKAFGNINLPFFVYMVFFLVIEFIFSKYK